MWALMCVLLLYLVAYVITARSGLLSFELQTGLTHASPPAGQDGRK